MALDDTFMLSVIGQAAGQDHVHTLHFRDSGVASPQATLAAAWRTGCENAYRGLFDTYDAPNATLRVTHKCWTGAQLATYEFAVPGAAQAGFRAPGTNRAPPFIASLFKVKTALAGKDNTGRFFIGGMLDTDFDLSDVSAAYIVLMQAYIDALKATFVTPAAPPFRMVVFSKKRRLATPTPCALNSTFVTDIVASARPTTMRSRKLGHGN